MVVEVLSPQDCLKDPSTQGLLSLPMKYQQRSSNPNPNPNRAARAQPQPDRRKPQQQRKPARPNNHISSPVQKPQNLVVGQVKILKRGEDLPKPEASELPKPSPPSKENRSPQKVVPDLGSKVRNPKKGPKQTRLADNPALGFYAGPSVGIASPSPSSLPVPRFVSDKGASEILKILGLNLS